MLRNSKNCKQKENTSDEMIQNSLSIISRDFSNFWCTSSFQNGFMNVLVSFSLFMNFECNSQYTVASVASIKVRQCCHNFHICLIYRVTQTTQPLGSREGIETINWSKQYLELPRPLLGPYVGVWISVFCKFKMKCIFFILWIEKMIKT